MQAYRWVRFAGVVAVPMMVAGADVVTAQEWASWRGPANDGMTSGDAPVTWNGEEHVKWKVPIVGRGLSSPVVWGNQIFVTTAVKIDADGAIIPEPPESRPGFRGGDGGGWGPGDWQGQDGGRGGDDGDWQRRREEWLRSRGSGGDTDGDRERRREEWRRRRAASEGQAPQGPGQRRGGGDGQGRGGGWWGHRNSEPQVAHRFLLLSIDRTTGAVMWERAATEATPHEGFFPFYGSFASHSPVTDGAHVFAYFGSRGVYCYDLDGNLVWSKDLGQMNKIMQFGEGTPIVLHEDRVIIKWDHEGESFIVALDKATGKELWRTPRDEFTSWSPPLVVEHDRQKQVVVAASRKVRSYDFETGDVIWEVAGLGQNQIPAPVHQGDLVYVMSGFMGPNLMAIRLGNQGDLTDTDAIVWSETRALSYTGSPVLFDDQLYVLTDRGILTNLDATTGAMHYRERLPGPASFKSSPVGVNGKLYLSSEDGRVFVVRMGPTFELLATNTLEDAVFIATPAISGGEIFLRSHDSLYRIGELD